MDKLLRALATVPLIVGIVKLVKMAFATKDDKGNIVLPDLLKRLLWVIACVVGIAVAYGYVLALDITTMNNAMIIMGGIIAGLSATGLYEASKNVIKAIKPTV